MFRTCCLVIGLASLTAAATFAQPPAGAFLPGRRARATSIGAAGTPCVAAHSTTRALYASYGGPLYQVKRQSDGQTLDVGVVQPVGSPVPDAGGYADAAAQDAFCANTICVINRLYDQSGKGNHLHQAPPGPSFPGPAKGGFDTQPIADMAPITLGGHKAYGVFIMPGMGFRNNDATDLAIDDEPEGIYYVVDGTHYDSGCCFDYGNSSTNGRAVGTGTMETTYFGTSTNWGRGDGPGPWIMADMEAGLFSGYDAKLNAASPTIDSWRFVTAVVNGGGGNRWELRGGNAQSGGLTTFYSGIRPGSLTGDAYFPMHKQGAILLGIGGDNGNGSAGTFYEGVMTTGFPTGATTDAVQANIVAARYDVRRVDLSRVGTFTPESRQEVTATFTNTTGSPVAGVRLSLSLPERWTALASGATRAPAASGAPVAPGASVSTTFTVTSPAATGAGFMAGKVEWTDPMTGRTRSETATRRVRNALPVKINEVRFGTSTNPTDQFIELYNPSPSAIDLSRWTLIHTPSQWGPVTLATIPSGTTLAAGAFYVLGLSGSGLAAPASPGDAAINVRSTTGFEAGQTIDIDGETRAIITIGTAAAPMTTVFTPVSTGPWITIPAGSTNLPVANAAGFTVGQKIGIDVGGHYELATVTAVGKAATQSTLTAAADAGATSITVEAASNMTVGDTLTVGTGGRKETVTVATHRFPWRERHRHRPGRSAPARPPVGRRRVRRGDGDQFLTGHAVPARERRRGTGTGQRHDARQASREAPRVRCARGQSPGHDRRLPRGGGAESVVRGRALDQGGVNRADGRQRRAGCRRDGLRIAAEQLERERDHRQPGDRGPRGRPTPGWLHRRGSRRCRRRGHEPWPLPGRRRRRQQLHRFPVAVGHHVVGRIASRREQHQGRQRGELRHRPSGHD